MDKRKLSKIERPRATQDMIDLSGRMEGVRHIVTAELIDNKKILLLNFFRTKSLAGRNTEAEFRTFLSHEDYITQDLKTSKTKWFTASFAMMTDFVKDCYWNTRLHKWAWKASAYIKSDKDKHIIEKFFEKYADFDDEDPTWSRIHAFQQEVMNKRLERKHRKVTDKIDALMEPIKHPPQEFFDWVWETGMSFSRYLIYKEDKKGEAVCECTHCKNTGIVKRKDVRLRNNEKGICPFCGSPVTVKARGRMPAQILDERWFLYVDPTDIGFVLRYFKADRCIKNDRYIGILLNKSRSEEDITEYSRAFYTFPDGKPKCKSYEWGVYKQRGKNRWCPDTGKIACIEDECFMIPAKAFDLIGSLPDGEVEVLPEKNRNITIKADKIKNKYQTMDPGSFPLAEVSQDSKNEITIKSNVLLQSMKRVAYAI